MQYTAAYIRVSTDEQARKGFSIRAQKERLTAYCRKKQWVYKLFEDPGFSAGSLKRPSMQALIAEIKAGNIERVVLWKLDRLSRRMADLYKLLTLFEHHNVELVSVTENVITNSSLGKFLTGILGSVAELEREQIRERIRAVKNTRKKVKKLPLGHTPLGYGPGFEIIPEQAEIVREIFRLARLMGPTGIAQFLNQKGLRTRDGNIWSRVAVSRLLRNPTYAALITLDDGTVINGNYEPIIPQDLFTEVNSRIRKRAGKKSATSRHLLSGIMVCGVCGKTMGVTGDYKAEKRFYVCMTKANYGASACTNHRFMASFLEKEIKKLVEKYAGEERQNVLSRVEQKVRDSQFGHLRQQMAALDQALSNVDRRISKLYSLFEEDKLDKTSLIDRISVLKNEKLAFTSRRVELMDKIRDSDPERTLNLLKEAFDRFGELWDVSSPIDRKHLLKAIVKSIVAYPDRVKVTFQWGDQVLIPYVRRKNLISLTDDEKEELARLDTLHANILLMADQGVMAKDISARLDVDFSKVLWVLGSFNKERMDYLRRARTLRSAQEVPPEVEKVLKDNREIIGQLSPTGLINLMKSEGVIITSTLAKNIIYRTPSLRESDTSTWARLTSPGLGFWPPPISPASDTV